MKRGRWIFAAAALGAFVLLNIAPSCFPTATWQPANGEVRAIAVHGDTVYVGGNFTHFSSPDGLTSVERRGVAALDFRTGALKSWNANVTGGSAIVIALAVSPDGNRLYIGGAFNNVKGVARANLAAVTTSGAGSVIAAFPTANNDVYALAASPDGNTVYVGGFFDQIGGQNRNRLAAVSVASNDVTNWAPNPNASVRALAVTSDSTLIYAGGLFTEIGSNNADRQRLAALRASDATATGWNHRPNGVVRAIALPPGGSPVYVGGFFSQIESGGYTSNRDRVAAIDPSVPGFVTGWNANANGNVLALAVSPTGRGIYLGGDFTEVKGSARNRLALVNSAGTGTVEEWKAPANATVSALGITDDGATVFAGGAFTTVHLSNRSAFAQFDPYVHGDWFMPGGSTAEDSYILISNPTAGPLNPTVYFRDQVSLNVQTSVPIPAQSRRTVKINDFVEGLRFVSTYVSGAGELMCERAVYHPRGGPWHSGGGTIGISEPAMEWNLPEGATHYFDQYIHIFNPCINDGEHNQRVWVEATFMDQAGFTHQTQRWLDGERLWMIHVNAIPGWDDKDQVSTRVCSLEGPIVVDRTMYWPKWPAGQAASHTSRGLTGSSTEWYLSEGATHLFDMYVLVSNPDSAATADVDFTFMDESGSTQTVNRQVGPQSRETVSVHNVPGWGNKPHVSTVVESKNNVPVFAERAMYFPKGGPSVWRGGHNTIGSPAPAVRWHLPEGATHFFDEYILFANPHATAEAEVRVRLMRADGWTQDYSFTIRPRSRRTLPINDLPGWDNRDQVSAVVESVGAVPIPIFVERAMYFPKGGPAVWQDGHATIGIAE